MLLFHLPLLLLTLLSTPQEEAELAPDRARGVTRDDVFALRAKVLEEQSNANRHGGFALVSEEERKGAYENVGISPSPLNPFREYVRA